MAPLFVKLLADVNVLKPVVPSATRRIVEPALVASDPFTVTAALASSVPWLSRPLVAPIVTVLSVIVWPLALVRVPGPLNVTFVATKPVVAFVTLVAKFAVRLFRISVPVPPMVPAFWLRAPPLDVQLWPAPMVTVPLLVKLGAVPLWFSVKSAALA